MSNNHYSILEKHIFDGASVHGNARVCDNATVSDTAFVSGNACVSEAARVYSHAFVSGNANVSGDARVYGDAYVSGNARVCGYAQVDGNAVVIGNAVVFGTARVTGNALLSGDALVETSSDYLVIGPAKSSGRFTTAHRDLKKGIRVNCGCFSGTLKEFATIIEKTHAENKEYLEQYRLFSKLIAVSFGVTE